MKINRNLTIVTYHYVRDIKNSQFPKINGLEFKKFKKQLDYLQENYNIITTTQLINAKKNIKELPVNSCYLTFDDGFKDHIKYVLPEILKRKIHSSFFIPGLVFNEKKVLNVHKIHFILASVNNYHLLKTKIETLALENGLGKYDLKKFWKKYGKPNSYDNAEVNYIKRLLQRAFSLELRNKIINKLFREFVGESESSFSKKLYMSKNDIRKLVKSGMYVGCHGYSHNWLDSLTYNEQKKDIKAGIKSLKKIGVFKKDWIMCYPYGAYNIDTLNILKKEKCLIGLTVKKGFANIRTMNSLTMPRLDTNELPK